MRIGKISPLRHRNTGDPAHDDLSDPKHIKAHEGEEANFQTVEEEDEFRKFVKHYEMDVKGWEYIRSLLVDGEVYFETDTSNLLDSFILKGVAK